MNWFPFIVLCCVAVWSLPVPSHSALYHSEIFRLAAAACGAFSVAVVCELCVVLVHVSSIYFSIFPEYGIAR